MAPAPGYSGTPQAKKLGLEPRRRVALDHPPPGWALTDPPEEVIVVDRPEPADVVVAFFPAADELPGRLPDLGRRIFPAGALWIAWPRRAGGHHSDITDHVVRQHILPLGLVDTKVAALDDDWSALRVVWRREHRSPRMGEAPPTSP